MYIDQILFVLKAIISHLNPGNISWPFHPCLSVRENQDKLREEKEKGAV